MDDTPPFPLEGEQESAALLPSYNGQGKCYEPLDCKDQQLPPPPGGLWHSIRASLTNLHQASRICRDWITAILLFLLPSFLATPMRPKAERSAPKALRSTAYLDGLRGLAAWAVFNGHLTASLSKDNGMPWGFKGNFQSFCDIWRLPVIRIALNGSFSVSLFFVISGFALSISPIIALRKRPHDPAAAMEKLSSSIFRRPFRLFVPSLTSTILVLILVRCGYWDFLRARKDQFAELIHGGDPGRSAVEKGPKIMQYLWGQIEDLLKNDRNMLSVYSNWRDRFENKYNAPLWTIALEFRASLVLYMTHASLLYMSRTIRTVILVTLIVFGVAIHAFDFPLFWCGYLIAEYSPCLPPEPSSSSSSSSSHSSSSSLPASSASSGQQHKLHFRIRNILGKVIPWLLFIIGICLGSFPRTNSGARRSPLYHELNALTPFSYPSHERYYESIGAVALILAIERIPLLCRFYGLPLIQYMGRISFAFYLCHIHIVKGIGQYFFWLAWSITGKESCGMTILGYMLGYIPTFLLVVWVADIFWRAVDIPTVKCAAMFENWLKSR